MKGSAGRARVRGTCFPHPLLKTYLNDGKYTYINKNIKGDNSVLDLVITTPALSNRCSLDIGSCC